MLEMEISHLILGPAQPVLVFRTGFYKLILSSIPDKHESFVAFCVAPVGILGPVPILRQS